MSLLDPTGIERFLSEPRHAVLATNRTDGPPQLSPVWYVYENGQFYITISTQSAKHRNLVRDPRVSLCIDAGHPDARAVTVSGIVARIEEETPENEPIRRRIIRRYCDSDVEADRYYEQVQQELDGLLLVIVPERISGQDYN